MAVVVAALAAPTHADFLYTPSFDVWQSLIPTYTTLDFVDLDEGDYLRSQYASLGVDFTDGGTVQEAGFYWQDGHGVSGGCIIEAVFDTPMYAIGAYHPGALRFVLYSGDEIVYVSPPGGDGYNNFHAAISSVPFDRVWLMGVTLGPPACDPIYVDNIYFSSVPGPAAWGLLALSPLMADGRRRRNSRRM